MTRKILYSPNYGAGWVTWQTDPRVKALMLTYQPIIDYLEAGGTFSSKECEPVWNDDEVCTKNLHPLLRQLFNECRDRFDETPYLGGATDLRVVTVAGRVRLHEYDGFESYEEEGEFSGWL